MNFLEAFYISLDSIWSNKMRSILTMLGLIIGISSVVTIISLGNATQNTIETELSSLGVNSITVYLNRDVTIKPSDKLIHSDIDMIEENFSDAVMYATPSISKGGVILSDVSETNVNFTAATENTFDSENLNMIEGRFLNDFDSIGYKKNIVIDSDLATELFGSGLATGNKILISTGATSQSYFVVGVYEMKESLGGFSTATVYLPYTTMDAMFNMQGILDSLKITFKSSVEDPNLEIKYIINSIERKHSNIGEEVYSTFSAEDLIDTVSQTLGLVTLFIGAIAAISLVVGGIGVMNIMLVSVTERTREIGIRKALGAQYTDIMLQFLIEAVTIAILGGIIGSIFGAIFTSVGGNLMKIDSVVSGDALVMAVVFSTSIGIFFGLYPANKAAKLDPIVALRHE
ncbi:MAG: ABC transporter permease [Clostridiales bacterium]|nr:ABC transporter permease [Clostridiales bacterium]